MARQHNSREEVRVSDLIKPKGQQALRRALQEARGKNEELASQNLALKEQMTSKELSWEDEKKKLLDKEDSLASTLLTTRYNLDNLVKVVESTRASSKNSEEQCKTLERQVMEKELQARYLQQTINHRTKETRQFENFYRAQINTNKRMTISFDKTIIEFNAEWESRWIVRAEEVATELTTLKDSPVQP